MVTSMRITNENITQIRNLYNNQLWTTDSVATTDRKLLSHAQKTATRPENTEIQKEKTIATVSITAGVFISEILQATKTTSGDYHPSSGVFRNLERGGAAKIFDDHFLVTFHFFQLSSHVRPTYQPHRIVTNHPLRP
jgi:hypothetical protein